MKHTLCIIFGLLLLAGVAYAATPVDVNSIANMKVTFSNVPVRPGDGGVAVSYGDLNHDGIQDMLIGMYGADGVNGTQSDYRGLTFVIYGRHFANNTVLNLPEDADVTLYCLTDSCYLGDSTGIGDIDDDGDNEAVIQSHLGTYIIESMPSSGSHNIEDVYEVKYTNALGQIRIGDVNGDGKDDLILGQSSNFRSSAYVAFANNARNGDYDMSAVYDQYWAVSGMLMTLGDYNGDGKQDLGFSNGNYAGDAGEMYICDGTAQTGNFNTGSCQSHIYENTACQTIGSDYQAADMNNDGYDDLIASARTFGRADCGENSWYGRGFIFYGGPSGLASGVGHTIADVQFSDLNTYFVDSADAQDFNGDGIPDVEFGRETPFQSGIGCVYGFINHNYTWSSSYDFANADYQICEPTGAYLSTGTSNGNKPLRIDMNGDAQKDTWVLNYANPATTDKIYFTFGVATWHCAEEWIPHHINGTCNASNMNREIMYYTDSNQCNTTALLPQDNGTTYNFDCNYCTENIQEYNTSWSQCLEFRQSRVHSWTDLNKASCCDVTGLQSDCHINGYSNVTETRVCGQSTEEGPSAGSRGEVSYCSGSSCYGSMAEAQAAQNPPPFSIGGLPASSQGIWDQILSWISPGWHAGGMW